ncbi:MAG: ABC transporter permease [Candidatus Nezhaarchaeota archaeon]|nr:ABC transporter permease [Candidatus Nezhaarchaeota archaeon]
MGPKTLRRPSRRWLGLARHFKAMLLKEVKELVRDPRILLGVVIVPLVMFPLMGYAFSVAGEAAEREVIGLRVALIDCDGSAYSLLLRNLMRRLGDVVSIPAAEPSWIESALSEGARIIVKVPKGFSSNLSVGLPGTVEVYLVARSLSISEVNVYGAVSSVLNLYARELSTRIINQHAPEINASTVLNPLLINGRTILKGSVIDVPPESLASTVMSQAMMMPIIIMVLIVTAAQIAATSIAMEKEEKTLETLLTLPVRRVTILWGKLMGSAVVAVVGVAAYMVGFTYYMNALTGRWQQGTPSNTPLLQIPLEGYAILTASLFFSLMSALALAMLLGAYTQDVRSAQSLLGILYVPVFVPALILMFADISTLPLGVQVLLYAIPFSHPVIAAKSMAIGEYIIPILGALYNVAFMVVVLYVAARLFNSEKVVVAKLTLKRKPLGG